jgi:hypothetical protein
LVAQSGRCAGLTGQNTRHQKNRTTTPSAVAGAPVYALSSDMDRSILLNHLAMAERHITNGEQHIRRQRQHVLSLQRGRPGSKTLKQALAMLDTMERKQRDHIAERDRLRQKLDGHP